MPRGRAFAHAGHHAEGLWRRYLLLPGIRSSEIHVYDTHPDPRQPTLVRTITADELAKNADYSRPHTLHCGPDGIFMSCLGGRNGADSPGGIALLDHDTFDVLRAWETDRGPQYLAYDAWWHLNQNTLITSEWDTPQMIEDGIDPELLLGRMYGHALHFWDLAAGRTERHPGRDRLGDHRLSLPRLDGKLRLRRDPRRPAPLGVTGPGLGTYSSGVRVPDRVIRLPARDRQTAPSWLAQG